MDDVTDKDGFLIDGKLPGPPGRALRALLEHQVLGITRR